MPTDILLFPWLVGKTEKESVRTYAKYGLRIVSAEEMQKLHSAETQLQLAVGLVLNLISLMTQPTDSPLQVKICRVYSEKFGQNERDFLQAAFLDIFEQIGDVPKHVKIGQILEDWVDQKLGIEH